MTDRQAEQVDDLVDVWADEMGTEDATAVLFDQRLVAVDALGDAPGGVPVRYPLRLYPGLQALLARLRLRETHRCNRRDGEGYAWHAAIVGLAVIALEQVGGDDLGIVA